MRAYNYPSYDTCHEQVAISYIISHCQWLVCILCNMNFDNDIGITCILRKSCINGSKNTLDIKQSLLKLCGSHTIILSDSTH